MGKWAFFFAAAVEASVVGCMPGESCSPGYDCPAPDPCGPIGGYHCEANVLVFAGTTCATPVTTRTDCAAMGDVCISGSSTCSKACTADSDCTTDQYCAPLAATQQTSSAKAVCAQRLAKGADCTDALGACAKGLVCDDAPGAPGKKTCRADCSMSDPNAPRCPAGATMACVGTKAYRCDECGVGVAVARDCATAPDAANQCVVANDQAFCVVSPTPDPRCANVDSYCDGDTIVDCFQGFEEARADCAPQHCVDGGARCN